MNLGDSLHIERIRRARSNARTIRIVLGAAAIIAILSFSSRPAPQVHAEQQPVRQSKSFRIEYPYSLIPGGVETPDELRAKFSDPVIGPHYSDVGFRLQPAILQEDQWLYTSYRVNDKVFWTKNRVLVHKGEHILSDGRNLIRGRCGNRLSDTPRLPVRYAQPPEVLQDVPREVVILGDETIPSLAFEEPTLPELPFAGVPPYERIGETGPATATRLPAGVPGIVFPAPYIFPARIPLEFLINGHAPSALPIPTPEPGTGLLLVGALGLIGWGARNRKSR